MIALSLPNKKEFMQSLLCSTVFDDFLLSEAALHTFVSYTIDGHLNRDFFESDEDTDDCSVLADTSIVPFAKIRPILFSLIKGKRTPLAFRFVLQLPEEHKKQVLAQSSAAFSPDDVTGIFFNILFQDNRLTATTGLSYRSFLPDKSLEQEWDRLILSFLSRHHITYEVL